jgi:hypothetical protein
LLEAALLDDDADPNVIPELIRLGFDPADVQHPKCDMYDFFNADRFDNSFKFLRRFRAVLQLLRHGAPCADQYGWSIMHALFQYGLDLAFLDGHVTLDEVVQLVGLCEARGVTWTSSDPHGYLPLGYWLSHYRVLAKFHENGIVDKETIIKIIGLQRRLELRELALGLLFKAGIIKSGDSVLGHGVMSQEQLQELQTKYHNNHYNIM